MPIWIRDSLTVLNPHAAMSLSVFGAVGFGVAIIYVSKKRIMLTGLGIFVAGAYGMASFVVRVLS